MTTTTRSGYHNRTEYERIRIDEAALLDAIHALDSPYWRTPDLQTEVLDQIERIRSRLPDNGARIDDRIAAGIRYVRAAPDPRDPPGTIRYVVIQPDGTRRPRNARTVDDQAAGR